MSHSPAAQRIVTAALAHFADRGYDGGSLTEIGAAVGIRKASLYAHFSGKDALFRAAYEQALGQERVFAAQCFADEPAGGLPGLGYCESLLARYAASPALRGFLRTSYMPPVVLQPWIDAGHEGYLAQLRADFLARLAQPGGLGHGLSAEARARHAEVFLGIVDSVQVKLIYTTAELAAIRLNAMVQMMRDGLRRAGGEDNGPQ